MKCEENKINRQKNLPLVSIIIPVYNGANYLKEAIDSALAQTYENIEVIVVNDGSTDNTEEIALSYGDKIRYFNKENGGVSSALNLGIKNMRGEYFSWLSHDDKYFSTKVEQQVKALADCENPNTICLCGTSFIDKNSSIIEVNKKTYYDFKNVYSWQEGLKILILNDSFIGCALLIPKTVFEECGFFDETLRYCQDFLMWIKIFLNEYDLIYVFEKGVMMRIHDKQLTQTGKEVFHKDCVYMGDMLLPLLLEKSTKEYNFLYYYTLYNAKYNNPKVVKVYIKVGKEKKLFGCKELLKLKAVGAYGKIRPLIRKIYYKLFKKVKTQ